jgi:thiosulfate/3-mercaptopyruvate sulfurtransferase
MAADETNRTRWIRLSQIGGRNFPVSAVIRCLLAVSFPERSATPRLFFSHSIISISLLVFASPVMAQEKPNAPDTNTFPLPDIIVETSWLHQHINSKEIRIVDLRDAQKFQVSRIPGAVNLTREDLRTSTAPHFLLSTDDFEKLMISKGISSDHLVVAYDDRGGMDPAWLWWMLRYFGHEKSVVLNGGWQKWIAESRNVTTTGAVDPGPSSGFEANIHPEWIITADRLVELIGKPGTKLIDGRTLGEFEGNVEGWEHSYNDRRGRIPHAVHVLWRDILNADGTFKSASELRSHFVSKGIYPDDRIISYCLGGMRSSANLFALYHAGYRNIVLYHGSWWDWGERHDLPLETGPVDNSGTDI